VHFINPIDAISISAQNGIDLLDSGCDHEELFRNVVRRIRIRKRRYAGCAEICRIDCGSWRHRKKRKIGEQRSDHRLGPKSLRTDVVGQSDRMSTATIKSDSGAAGVSAKLRIVGMRASSPSDRMKAASQPVRQLPGPASQGASMS
jgi:hypothetical protein